MYMIYCQLQFQLDHWACSSPVIPWFWAYWKLFIPIYGGKAFLDDIAYIAKQVLFYIYHYDKMATDEVLVFHSMIGVLSINLKSYFNYNK